MLTLQGAILRVVICISICGRQVGASLSFRPFEPSLPCADGSPAGIYVEENPKVDIAKSRNHVIVFIGGGSCTSPDDCDDGYDMEPFKFSTRLYPRNIEGHTILSQDPQVNILHAHTKWLVPYCSQDFFLGDIHKGKVGEFVHAGSAIFNRAMSFWGEEVLSSVESSSSGNNSFVLDTVVVAGLSAGAVGVMNKVDKIREAVKNVGVKNLRLLLDSPSVMSDIEIKEKNYREAMATYVNFTEHPLCNPWNDFSLLYTSNGVSALPCCLSTHCMFRHDPRLASFYQSEPSVTETEELLILDSAYDSFAHLASVFDKHEDDSEENKLTREDIDDLWSAPEFAGQRKTRALETAAFARASANTTAIETARIKWVFTSCVTHMFLVPALEFLFLSCTHGDYEDEDVNIVCSDDGFATEFEASSVQFTLRIWRTTETWDLAEFDGQSIHEIVTEFLLDEEKTEQAVALTVTGRAIDLRHEGCYGPNCLEEGVDSSVEPSCQSLVELGDPFVSIPVSFQVVCVLFISVWVIISLYIRSSDKRDKVKTVHYLEEVATNTDSMRSLASSLASVSSQNLTSSLSFAGITVTTATGSCLLDNVGFDLKRGTVNAICGRSGSGKSTLLRVLSQLQQQGLSVSMAKGEIELTSMSKAFLRQENNVMAFGKLVPADYLRLSAKIYGTTDEKFVELYLFTKQLFGRGGKSAAKTEKSKQFNPFVDAKIENLSGGQKRIMSIVCTLLLDPGLILLDEPLSGLDSISSLEVMDALRLVAESRKCTIIMVVHQPSEEILEHFHQLVVLSAGKVVYNCDIQRCGTQLASFNLNKSLLQQSAEASNETEPEHPSGTSGHPPDVDATEAEPGKANSGHWADYLAMPLKQVQPLSLRMHKQYGWGWMDIVVVTATVALCAAMLLVEHAFPVQVVLMTLVFIALPAILEVHKILEYAEMWIAHKAEMDDRKVSLLAFQLATATSTFGVPVIAVAVGLIPAYAILGWSFKTFLVQALFSVIHMIIPLQLGRVLSVFFQGDFSKLVKLYTILLFLNFLFSSASIPSRKFPESVRWMFALSIDFWAISGAVMNQFDEDNYSNDESCLDFLTCVLSDGKFIVHFFGFAPMSNQFLALGILLFWCVFLLGLEYVLLRDRCASVSLCGRKVVTSNKRPRELGAKGNSVFYKSLKNSWQSFHRAKAEHSAEMREIPEDEVEYSA